MIIIVAYNIIIAAVATESEGIKLIYNNDMIPETHNGHNNYTIHLCTLLQ